MSRFFNTAGPCVPGEHYMLPPERRLPAVRGWIEQRQYFVIHAPRQTGKTTSFRTLAAELNREGRYAALHTSCERAQMLAGGAVEEGVQAVIEAVQGHAELQLEPSLRPPAADLSLTPRSRLWDLLVRWARGCPRPVVLFLDEIDALIDDTLVAVLRQLRDGYVNRPGAFPQSVALIGLRDVRDYKIRLRPDADSLGTSSPFNIKVESITLRNFTDEEVAELYEQHTAETGQSFAKAAKAMAWELTRGQPWLVNALARQVTQKDIQDRSVEITAEHIETAKETLVERRDTHLDSLVERLREPRVRRVLEPILAGELLLGDRLDDDIAYVEDLGLVERRQGSSVWIANPIYHEVIPRALAFVTQLSLPPDLPWYVQPDGKLDLQGLLEGFLGFWKEHGETLLSVQPYHEAAAQLVLLAFLQRVVNGGGFIDREYAVGSGRMDLCIRWPHPGGLQREALELKVWRDGRPDPLEKGLGQLSGYLERLGLEGGTLVLFDRRSTAPPAAERCSSEEAKHKGRNITVLRL